MSNNEVSSARVITIRLRIPALVLACVILAGGLVWAFVLGVMTGRGQINDELAALMPKEQIVKADGSTEKAADEVEKLIKAEDLKYQESLRQNQPPPAPAATPAEMAEAARRDAAQAAQPSARPAERPAAQAPAQIGSFRYIYQVASYNREDQAKELAARLKGKGVQSEVEAREVQGASRFRVLISFEGDEKVLESMQGMLKKDFKINNILPRSKTPLGR